MHMAVRTMADVGKNDRQLCPGLFFFKSFFFNNANAESLAQTNVCKCGIYAYLYILYLLIVDGKGIRIYVVKALRVNISFVNE